jgi:hypothetical protein
MVPSDSPPTVRMAVVSKADVPAIGGARWTRDRLRNVIMAAPIATDNTCPVVVMPGAGMNGTSTQRLRRSKLTSYRLESAISQ